MSAIVNNEKPRFVYWGLNARAQMSMLMLRSANVEYIWDTDTANTWPEPKDRMPFGQLPVLYHNDLVVAQSRTIARYCAKLANIWPENLEEKKSEKGIHSRPIPTRIDETQVDHCVEDYARDGIRREPD